MHLACVLDNSAQQFVQLEALDQQCWVVIIKLVLAQCHLQCCDVEQAKGKVYRSRVDLHGMLGALFENVNEMMPHALARLESKVRPVVPLHNHTATYCTDHSCSFSPVTTQHIVHACPSCNLHTAALIPTQQHVMTQTICLHTMPFILYLCMHLLIKRLTK